MERTIERLARSAHADSNGLRSMLSRHFLEFSLWGFNGAFSAIYCPSSSPPLCLYTMQIRITWLGKALLLIARSLKVFDLQPNLARVKTTDRQRWKYFLEAIKQLAPIMTWPKFSSLDRKKPCANFALAAKMQTQSILIPHNFFPFVTAAANAQFLFHMDLHGRGFFTLGGQLDRQREKRKALDIAPTISMSIILSANYDWFNCPSGKTS